jgi:hypothetical protein
VKPIVVLADTVRDGQCRSCGAAITWATVLTSQKPMPFDRPLVLMPALAWDTVEPQVRHVDMVRTVSHFATCPHAGAWRQFK